MAAHDVYPVWLSYLERKYLQDHYKLKIPKGGNQNPQIEEEQTTQWPKEKVQKDKQWSIKHTHKTKDRVTRTLLKPELNAGAPEWKKGINFLNITTFVNIFQENSRA